MISFPSSSQVLVDDGKTMSRSWAQWFREWLAACGLSPSVETHRPIAIPGSMVDCSVGTVALAEIVTGIWLPHFAGGVDDIVVFGFRLPNDYREESALKPWIEYAQRSTGAGDINWRWSYLWLRSGDSPAAASTDLDEVSTAPGVEEQVVRVDFDEISTTTRRGDSMAVSLWRLGTADTLVDDVCLVSCGLTYVADGLGTSEVHP